MNWPLCIGRMKLNLHLQERIDRAQERLQTPTSTELQEDWFGSNGDLKGTLADTAAFLLAENKITDIAPSYAINRSY